MSARAVTSALTTIPSCVAGAESGKFGAHRVGAWHQPDELKCAALVGHGRLVAADRSERVRERDR
jgi:hypothetical protein